MKLRRWAVTLLVVLALPMLATAADYRYVKPDLFRSWLEIGKKMVIVDIQAPTDFGKRHIKGAVETNAYPVKTDAERQRLDATLAKINAGTDDVVIVCPRGGGGAKNTYDYLKGKGVEEKRLFILEKGMEGWPHPKTRYLRVGLSEQSVHLEFCKVAHGPVGLVSLQFLQFRTPGCYGDNLRPDSPGAANIQGSVANHQYLVTGQFLAEQ